ncbi:hypothetical protein A1O3_06294 [Capronia epimyces CBS 606.96]|uniref:DUF7924 domain-containing protein n=1 Tax=Capronia epimyces CBS 606.96 TaxID=1182542 RepID=W9XZT3_9EURO|nr:uncharacterized protein A1O3_06294 [Capronia epimyces CBS 606.96]EXJ82481.1 hypothetical protein A1O3_06294 [Capronia epimyces CBS 606.96]
MPGKDSSQPEPNLASEPSSLLSPTAHPQASVIVHKWLDGIRAGAPDQENVLQEKELQGNPATIESIEIAFSPLDSMPPWEAVDDQMPEQDSPPSTFSGQTKRLDPTSSAYWGTLKRNNVVLDQAGLHIPHETKIKNLVIKIWHEAEPTVSAINKSPLFDLDYYPTLTEGGGDTPWTRQPLPSNPEASVPILTPEPVKHFGFPLALESEWSDEELGVAEHPFTQPYTQPSRENMFPCLIFELESEATKGSLYAAEASAAGAGAHRVASLLWLLDVVEPGRERACTDALAFSSVVSQRQAVAYVHFYNPANQTFYMSFIDAFYFVKSTDAQSCRDHHKNVAEWMLNILQPIVRDLLTRAHPIVKTW